MQIKDEAIVKALRDQRGDVLKTLSASKDKMIEFMGGADTRPYAQDIIQLAKNIVRLQALADLMGGYEVDGKLFI